MALRSGVDTSILVRLVAREPQEDFERCVSRLGGLIEERGCEVFASNQAIGEAFAALMHHYGVASADARSGLLDALTSGLVAPLNGPAVLEALSATGDPGLFDRLIVNDYSQAGLETLTLDRSMASLSGAQRL
ncbi:MAG: hypothetical protein OXG33_00355 [Chloroflexi bacterium]|nr:hypothetical protein [Chloroflexota bacterium]